MSENQSGKGADETDVNRDAPDSSNTMEDISRNPDPGFPVVGIGASAGGIEALQQFFNAMPNDSGMAFVVILHLQPDRESHLTEILQQRTQMKVEEVTESNRLGPDRVFIIPPNKVLRLKGDVFELLKLPDSRLMRKPVDAFFLSLAETCRERAIGIIFSGTGGNGSVGAGAIKRNGGIVLAQDPKEAKYPGMPGHAIATGNVDLTLKIEEMPEVLLRYVHHPYLRRKIRDLEFRAAPEDPHESPETVWNGIHEILTLLRRQTGREFRCFKKNMLIRRILRRMGLRNISNYREYLRTLRDEPNECEALVKDLLIGVSRFFREPGAWEVLRRKVLAGLVAAEDRSAAIRAWVPGCASGEEAYTLAILLYEEARKAGCQAEIKIFATDVGLERLQRAREGVYPDSIEIDLPPDLLNRYFDKMDGAYQVRSVIREIVVFARHDILSDPPFSQLDLVSCRNLLIYLEAETQAKVLALFHFSLKQKGYVFLGSAETIGSRESGLYETVSKKWRIYRRVGPTRHDLIDFPLYGIRAPRPDFDPPGNHPPSVQKPRLKDLVNRSLAVRYAPAAVLANRNFEAIYFHGETQRYLTQPSGMRTANVLDMARDGLRAKIKAAMIQALDEKRLVRIDDARFRRGNEWLPVTIAAVPVKSGSEEDAMILMTFETAADNPSPEPEPIKVLESEENDVIRELREEIRTTRFELESSIQELENANEEQRASNEEITSINEELQSTNEELETSKEELQSLNEELSTTNHQLHNKLQELENANNDLSNLLSSTDLATIFLDTELHIRWFSPAINELLSVISSDVGRPVTDFSTKFHDPDLLSDARIVLDKLSPISRQVKTDDKWYIRRVLPYRTGDNRIAGVVITFSEVTELKNAQEKQRRLATVVRDSNDAVIVLGLQGTILEWNRGAKKMYGWKESEIAGNDFTRIVPHGERRSFREMFEKLVGQQGIESEEAVRRNKDGKLLTVSLTGSLLKDDRNQPVAVALTERDITEIKNTQKQLERFNDLLDERVRQRTRQLRKLSLDLSRAEENERRRIAEVLHDDLQQILAGARFCLDRAVREVTGDLKNLEQLDNLLEKAIHSTRELSHQLSPPILQEGFLPALEWAKRWWKEKNGVDLRLHLDSDAEPAGPEMRYLLFNACRELFFNIVKHAGIQEADVYVERRNENIRLKVEDRGRGFDPKDLDRDPDDRGFGLLNIRERFDALGGKMSIRARPGDGACITLTLPQPGTGTEEAAPNRPEGKEDASESVFAPTSGNVCRVLIVDDHEMIRDGLRMLLRDEPGIEIIGEAPDGETALEIVERYQPELVLMDVSMPGMGGVETTRRIRARFPLIRVLALSMYEDSDRARAMFDAGARAYVEKTAPSEELLSAVRSIAETIRSSEEDN